VTLTVTDNINPPVSVQFPVTVAAANVPPTVDQIAAQSMSVGEARDVPYSAFDADGDPLSPTATSDNQGVVTANVNVTGMIALNAVGSGQATVTLTVTDNINPPVSVQFPVTVAATNQFPVIQQVGAQTVDVGASLSVQISASDPDGDPFTLLAVSDNPGAATAVENGTAEVIVTGVAPGTANVTVEVNDGRGGTASISFPVTVLGMNNPPVIQPIGDQSLAAGEQIQVTVSIVDPDGDPVTLTALSQNPGVVTTESFGTDTIALTGVGEGVTAVDVTADDAKGGVATATFNVTVSSPPTTFDLMAYPIVPDVPQAMAQSLYQVYQGGLGLGNQGGAFSKVGSAPMADPNFMVPFATGQYDLGNYGALQGTIDFYKVVSVRADVDPAINSFNAQSFAAGQDYSLDTLNSPAGGSCPQGDTNLLCEYHATKPTIALISFTPADVLFMDPSVFRSELQSLVIQTLQNGVIPVLATIPESGNASTQQLMPYNQAIVEVATQSNTTGIPLWNLWRAMQEHGITQPNGVAPEGPTNFSDAALGYGYNVRNLTALQTLAAVRQAVGIN
jgi:hypothetical protein